jgi:hypothetical protein
VSFFAGLVAAGVAFGVIPADTLRVVQVGEIQVVAASRRLDAAIALAEGIDRPTEWPGLGRRSPGALQFVLLADSAELAAATRGRAPGWGAAVAFPQSRTILLRADLPDLPRTLRHEVAHLILRQGVRGRLPLWFEEGYASRAAGEWGRLARLELHLSVVLGGVPRLGDLDGQLRSAAPMADRAYALAATAVGALEARIPGRDLSRLFAAMESGDGFDDAVQGVTGRDISRFEREWREETRKQYRGALWLAAGGWWFVAAGVVVLAWGARKRRERPRREALNVGWELPPEEPEVVPNETPAPPKIDPGGQGR